MPMKKLGVALSAIQKELMEKMGVSSKNWRYTLVCDEEVAIRFKWRLRFYRLSIKEVDGPL